MRSLVSYFHTWEDWTGVRHVIKLLRMKYESSFYGETEVLRYDYEVLCDESFRVDEAHLEKGASPTCLACLAAPYAE
jgi:hypothetical protein